MVGRARRHARDRPVCRQIALALRDEVAGSGKSGIRIIQIDEPAIREGLPVTQVRLGRVSRWAGGMLRLASACVQEDTQIHTHMAMRSSIHRRCHRASTPDVISIETARSRMELLDAVHGPPLSERHRPGVYDIHAPRCPTVEEMAELLATQATGFPPSADLGQPRLRAQDAQVGRGAACAREYGAGGAGARHDMT